MTSALAALGRQGAWLRFGLGLALLGALVVQVDAGAVLAGLARCGANSVVVAAAAAVVASGSAAWAWKLLLDAQGVRLRFLRVQLLYATGLFFGTFTPAGVGSEIARIAYLQQSTSKGLEAAISVVAARLFSFITLLVMAAGTSLMRAEGVLPVAAGLVATALAAVAIVAVAVSESGAARILPAPIARALVSAGMCITAFRDQPATLARCVLLLAAYHLLSVLPLYVLAHGLGASVTLLDAIALGLLMHLVAFMPTSPSAIGVYEASAIALLATLGISAADAIAISILERLVTLPVPLMGGLVWLGMRGARGRESETRAATPTDSEPERDGSEAQAQ